MCRPKNILGQKLKMVNLMFVLNFTVNKVLSHKECLVTESA